MVPVASQPRWGGLGRMPESSPPRPGRARTRRKSWQSGNARADWGASVQAVPLPASEPWRRRRCWTINIPAIAMPITAKDTAVVTVPSA